MNVINLVTKYLPILDEQYRRESISAILDTAPEFVRETANAKKVMIAKMRTDALADYSRSGGFIDGDTDLEWEEHTFRYDRGRSLQIDSLDNLETFGLAFGRLAGEFQRNHVFPEMDAIRFSNYHQNAGIKYVATLSAANVLATIDELDAQMDDKEVPTEGRIIFVRPDVYKFMMNDPSVKKVMLVCDGLSKALNKTVYEYNGHPIFKVPSGRFLEDVVLLDGTSEGQKAGGFKAKEGTGNIQLLMIHPSALVQISKRLVARFWAPTRAEMSANGADGVNPKADAWKFDYRVYHDAWVLEEKVDGIATVVADPTVIDAGSYNSETGEFTKGADFYLLGQRVAGTLPYGAADDNIGLDAGNRFTLHLSNPRITAKDMLPAGEICTVSNNTAGYVHKYDKAAFEDDGSLILVTNVQNKGTIISVEVEWEAGVKTVYNFTFLDAVFAPAE